MADIVLSVFLCSDSIFLLEIFAKVLIRSTLEKDAPIKLCESVSRRILVDEFVLSTVHRFP